ncbi:MAG: hypothetical protein Q7J31_13735 [Syntrophales bacterium]|nr:hypothetical protein [Syntrophales bacterium]
MVVDDGERQSIKTSSGSIIFLIERVWKLTRKLCTHNRYFAMLEDIAETVFHQFDIWSQPDDVLRRL